MSATAPGDTRPDADADATPGRDARATARPDPRPGAGATASAADVKQPGAGTPAPTNAPAVTTTATTTSPHAEPTTAAAPAPPATVTVAPVSPASPASPTAATATAAAPTPNAPAPPTVATPAAQLVSVVAPLRNQPDGSYRLTVDLHPAELGRVQVEMHVQHGEVSLHLQAEHASTDALLRDALGDLRDRLQSAGLRTGGVVVDQSGVSSQDRAANPFGKDGDGGTPERGFDAAANGDLAGPTTETDRSDTATDALVDVRI